MSPALCRHHCRSGRLCPCCAGIFVLIAFALPPALQPCVCPVTKQSQHVLASLPAPRHCRCRQLPALLPLSHGRFFPCSAGVANLCIPTLRQHHKLAAAQSLCSCNLRRGGIVVTLIITRDLVAVPSIWPTAIGPSAVWLRQQWCCGVAVGRLLDGRRLFWACDILAGGRCCRGGLARTPGHGDSHHTSFVASTPQPLSRLQCPRCRHCSPCPPKLRRPVQGLLVLGVVILGDDKRVFFVVVLLLLLVVGVVAEGCQRPPHNHGAREVLECGPRFVVGHKPLNSEGKSGCCHNAVVQAYPRATLSASCADFAPDGSGRQGSEQRWFRGGQACNLAVIRVVLVNALSCLAAMAGRRCPWYLWVRPQPWVPCPTHSCTAALQNRPH
jgi:hypothetical protein